MTTYEQLEEVNKLLKTTDIKGKEYVEVNERIKAFRMLHPEGLIDTHLVSNENGVCVIKAQVGYYEEDGCVRWLGTGYAYEKEESSFINKTSYIENCETSAVGRALGMAGFGINTSVASADEVINAINNQGNIEVSKEDAEKYTLSFGTFKGKTLNEVNEEKPSYIEWLVKNSNDVELLACINVLFDMKKEDYVVSDNAVELTAEIMQLVTETGVDLDKIKEKYKVNSINDIKDEKILGEIKKRLVKVKETREKLAAQNEE